MPLKVIAFVSLVFLVSLSYGQCHELNSPQLLCTEVLNNGHVKVHVSIGSMGGNNKPDLIDRIELEYSSDGIFFNAVDVQYVGTTWPMPVKLIHSNASSNSLSGYYRSVAYCDTAGNYALPKSEVVKSILLTQRINANNHVVLEWNYDEASDNMLMIIDRKQISSNLFDSLRTMPMTKGNMQFIDSTLTTTDTFLYRVAFVNLDNFCQGKSNEVTVIFSNENPSTGIPAINSTRSELFPNPVKDVINLKYEVKKSSNVSIYIYNAMGQITAVPIKSRFTPSGIITEEILLPSSLVKGMFYLVIQSEDFTTSLPFYR